MDAAGGESHGSGGGALDDLLRLHIFLAPTLFQQHGRRDTTLTPQNFSDFLTYLAHWENEIGTYSSAKTVITLQCLGDSYENRYNQHGQQGDFDMAIECYNQTLLRMSNNDAEVSSVLGDLGHLHYRRYKATGKISDLQHALERWTQEASSVPDVHPYKKHRLNHLDTAYLDHFRHLGRLSDLDKAHEYYTQAVSLTPDDDAIKLTILSNLGDSYRVRFDHLGQTADLDAAIKYQNQARLLGSDQHPGMPGCLNHLGNSHLARYERAEQTGDLDTAIECIRKAVLLAPDEHPQKHAFLGNLGRAYLALYNRLRNVSDLELSIDCYKQAASLGPNGQLTEPAALNNLGLIYASRYRHLGQLADLDASINHLKQAVSLTQDEHLDKPARLSNLSISYDLRFSRLRQLSDIDAAIDYGRQATSLTPDGHPDKLGYLGNLGLASGTRYQRTRDITDLNTAIEVQGKAVSLTPNEHPHRPGLLDSLGTAYSTRYQHLKQQTDLTLAIQYQHEATSLLSDDHPDKAGFQSNLGNTYHTRYTHLSDPADLDRAIALLRSAISVISDDYSDKSSLLLNLGRLLGERHFHSGDVSEAFQSIHCFKQAALSVTGHPRCRSQAAQLWACFSAIHQPQSSLEAYQYFMSLIPQVVWLGSATESRYEGVTDVASVTLEAMTVAILAECAYEQAIEWLEQGRSVVWNQLLQLRSPLDELRVLDSSLAKELMSVAQELHGATTLKQSTAVAPNSHHLHEQSAQRYRRLAETWEQLVNRAQSLPGLSNFLGPKKAPQLVAVASTRTVVVVVVDKIACHALVLQQGSTNITCVPLTSLSHEKLSQAYTQLRRRAHGPARMDRKFTTHLRPDKEQDTVLGMLWADAVSPVLEYLGYTRVLPANELPHITWCTTGPLSFLPLHAAGDYSKPHSSLFDYAISSYTPTLSALLASPPDPAGFSGVALISQASTPGLSRLPGTTQELDKVAEQTKCMQTLRLEGNEATCEAVLDAMERHSWIHLACHATQDMANPTASAFHLHDGPLDIATISRKHLKHADHAFLSACQTATGDEILSEEAIHLAAGMIMAGYRTVIATMWPIDDHDAPLVAERFYEYMIQGDVPNGSKAARALHYAVSDLREKVGATAYLRWAPFVHIGQ